MPGEKVSRILQLTTIVGKHRDSGENKPLLKCDDKRTWSMAAEDSLLCLSIISLQSFRFCCFMQYFTKSHDTFSVLSFLRSSITNSLSQFSYLVKFAIQLQGCCFCYMILIYDILQSSCNESVRDWYP